MADWWLKDFGDLNSSDSEDELPLLAFPPGSTAAAAAAGAQNQPQVLPQPTPAPAAAPMATGASSGAASSSRSSPPAPPSLTLQTSGPLPVVGERIEVEWTIEVKTSSGVTKGFKKRWYRGHVTERLGATSRPIIRYDDGDEEELGRNEEWRLAPDEVWRLQHRRSPAKASAAVTLATFPAEIAGNGQRGQPAKDKEVECFVGRGLSSHALVTAAMPLLLRVDTSSSETTVIAASTPCESQSSPTSSPKLIEAKGADDTAAAASAAAASSSSAATSSAAAHPSSATDSSATCVGALGVRVVLGGCFQTGVSLADCPLAEVRGVSRSANAAARKAAGAASKGAASKGRAAAVAAAAPSSGCVLHSLVADRGANLPAQTSVETRMLLGCSPFGGEAAAARFSARDLEHHPYLFACAKGRVCGPCAQRVRFTREACRMKADGVPMKVDYAGIGWGKDHPALSDTHCIPARITGAARPFVAASSSSVATSHESICAVCAQESLPRLSADGRSVEYEMPEVLCTGHRGDGPCRLAYHRECLRRIGVEPPPAPPPSALPSSGSALAAALAAPAALEDAGGDGAASTDAESDDDDERSRPAVSPTEWLKRRGRYVDAMTDEVVFAPVSAQPMAVLFGCPFCDGHCTSLTAEERGRFGNGYNSVRKVLATNMGLHDKYRKRKAAATVAAVDECEPAVTPAGASSSSSRAPASAATASTAVLSLPPSATTGGSLAPISLLSPLPIAVQPSPLPIVTQPSPLPVFAQPSPQPSPAPSPAPSPSHKSFSVRHALAASPTNLQPSADPTPTKLPLKKRPAAAAFAAEEGSARPGAKRTQQPQPPSPPPSQPQSHPPSRLSSRPPSQPQPQSQPQSQPSSQPPSRAPSRPPSQPSTPRFTARPTPPPMPAYMAARKQPLPGSAWTRLDPPPSSPVVTGQAAATAEPTPLPAPAALRLPVPVPVPAAAVKSSAPLPAAAKPSMTPPVAATPSWRRPPPPRPAAPAASLVATASAAAAPPPATSVVQPPATSVAPPPAAQPPVAAHRGPVVKYGTELGRGGQCEVVEVTVRPSFFPGAFAGVRVGGDDVAKVALKRCFDGSPRGTKQRLAWEATMLRKASEARALNVLGVIAYEPKKGQLFLPLCKGGSVGAAFRSRSVDVPLLARAALVGLCRGLEQLHELQIAHRDVKLDNLLLTKSARPGSGLCADDVLLTDLGYSLARGINDGAATVSAADGADGGAVSDLPTTLPYTAPEVLERRRERRQAYARLLADEAGHAEQCSLQRVAASPEWTELHEQLRRISKEHEQLQRKDDHMLDRVRRALRRHVDAPSAAARIAALDRAEAQLLEAEAAQLGTVDWLSADVHACAVAAWMLFHPQLQADAYPAFTLSLGDAARELGIEGAIIDGGRPAADAPLAHDTLRGAWSRLHDGILVQAWTAARGSSASATSSEALAPSPSRPSMTRFVEVACEACEAVGGA